MSYTTEIAAADQYVDNVVLRINGGAYYSKRQPDSGLAIPAAQRVVQSLKVNPQTIDLESARTGFGSTSFTLIDLDHVITSLFNNNQNIFIGQTVEVWLGRITGSFDFADYFKLSKQYITRVSFKGEEVTFTSSEITSQFNKPVWNTKARLSVNYAIGTGSIICSDSIVDFPASGRLFIQGELINYSAKNNGTKTFTLVGTTTLAHSAGDEAQNVYTITLQNPINIFLRVLQSTGGGTYDTYPEGLGIADSEIDIAEIEALRDEAFVTDAYTFEVHGVTRILDWLSDQIFKTCSLRMIISTNSKLSLSILDQSIFGAATKTLDESNIEPKSVQFEVDDSLIKNVVEVRYAFNFATENFVKTFRLEDAESILNYREREPFIIEAEGIPDSAPGDAMALDRATRWLGRLKTAKPRISVTTFAKHQLAFLGERVLLVYDLPTEIGTRNFQKELEVMKRTFDVEKGQVKFELAFTNYSGLREAFISPSDLVVTTPSTSSITLAAGRGVLYSSGWKMRLYKSFVVSGGIYEILSVVGDLITFTTAFSPAAAIGDRIKFANYSEVVEDQRRYAFISDGALNFTFDSTRPYQITF